MLVCPDEKISTLPVEEQNQRVHAVMTDALAGQWPTYEGMLMDLWKGSIEALGEGKVSPLTRAKLTSEFWGKVRGLMPKDQLLDMTEASPPELKKFLGKFESFVDKQTGVVDEVALKRAVSKTGEFQRMYARLRRLVYSYLDAPRLPDGRVVSTQDILAKVRGERVPVPSPDGITMPVQPEGWVRHGIGAKALQKATSITESANELLLGTPFVKVLPTKDAMRRIGMKFGKAYGRIWETGELRRIKFNEKMHIVDKELQEVYGEHLRNPGFRVRVSYVLEGAHKNPLHPQYDYMKANMPTSEELIVAQKARQWLDTKADVFGIPKETLLKDYLYRVRAAGTWKVDMGKKPTPRLERRMMLERTGDMNPRETDSLLILRSYARAGYKWETFAEDGWLSEADLALTGLKAHPQEYEIVREYLQDVVGNASERMLFHNEAMQAISKAVTTHLHLPEATGKLAGPLFLKTFFSSAIGGRVIPCLKQFAQLHFVGGSFYGKYLFKGIEAAQHSKAWTRFRELGMSVEDAAGMGMGEEVHAALAGQGGPGVQKYVKVITAATKPFIKLDSLQRVINLHAGREMFMDATKDLWAGKISAAKWERRVKYRWFDGFHDFQNSLRSVLSRKGDSELLEKIANEYGRHTAEDTNWVYRAGNSPLAMRRHPYLLQFGTWPANFASYFARHLEYAAKTMDVRSLVYMAAMFGAVSKIGEAAGADFRGLYAPSVVGYRGGPLSSFVVDGLQFSKDLFYNQDTANVGIQNFLKDLAIAFPYGLSVKSLIKGTYHGDLSEVLGVNYLVDK